MNRTAPNRPGFSLIELMMLMSIIAVLMSINAIWIRKSLQFSTAMRERHRDHLNLTRLSNEIRFDVSRANQWSMPKPDELNLESRDGVRVRYKFDTKPNGVLVRSERLEKNVPADVVAGKDVVAQPSARTSKEQFQLSRHCELQLDATDFPGSLSIVVYRVADIPNPPTSGDSPISSSATVSQKTSSADTPSIIPNDARPVEAVIKLVPNRWSFGEREGKGESMTRSVRYRSRAVSNCSRSRNGGILVAVLACLATAMAIFLASLALGLTVHRQTRQELMVEQTRWLLDAGISHAVREIAKNPDYPGETISLKTSIREYQSSVLISVKPSNLSTTPSDQTSSKNLQVEVVAKLSTNLSDAHNTATQRSAKLTVPLN